MQVRVEEQDVDMLIEDAGGDLVLKVRPGLLGPRAFVALTVTLGSLEQGYQYLQRAV